MKIKWRDVFKFLSGAAFAGSVANFYLWLSGISVPFFGYRVSPTLLGWRAALQFVLFIAFGYFGWFAVKTPSASDDMAHLRQHLEGLLRVWDRVFSKPIAHDDSHLAFMALAFAARQGEHARNVLRLQRAVDTVLITRSMFEGLCQLLWAAHAPDDRPWRWRAFAYVQDWRTLQRKINAHEPVPPDELVKVEDGVKHHGDLFLNAKAREATAHGKPLPANPYVPHWHGTTIKHIFAEVEGEIVHVELYRRFSNWHHWDIAGFAPVLRFDPEHGGFGMKGSDDALTATALASAFQCLWQTMNVLDEIVALGIGNELERLKDSYVAIGRP